MIQSSQSRRVPCTKNLHLVNMGGVRSKGSEFESLQNVDYFSHLFIARMCCLKRPKINEKDARDVRFFNSPSLPKCLKSNMFCFKLDAVSSRNVVNADHASMCSRFGSYKNLHFDETSKEPDSFIYSCLFLFLVFCLFIGLFLSVYS